MRRSRLGIWPLSRSAPFPSGFINFLIGRFHKRGLPFPLAGTVDLLPAPRRLAVVSRLRAFPRTSYFRGSHCEVSRVPSFCPRPLDPPPPPHSLDVYSPSPFQDRSGEREEGETQEAEEEAKFAEIRSCQVPQRRRKVLRGFARSDENNSPVRTANVSPFCFPSRYFYWDTQLHSRDSCFVVRTRSPPSSSMEFFRDGYSRSPCSRFRGFLAGRPRRGASRLGPR